MKIFIGVFTLLVFIIAQPIVARNSNPIDSVGVKSINGKKFILYKIRHLDTWYSIARKYGQQAKEILDANKEALTQTLSEGQIILVPIKAVPQPVNETKTVQSQGKPIIHEVKKGETLYSISIKSGQSIQNIRQWNNFKSEILHQGQKLTVGYERAKKEQPATVVSQHPTDSSRQKAVGHEQAVALEKNLTDTSKAADAINKETKNEWKSQAVKGKEFEESGIASFIEDQDINPHSYFALHRTARKGAIIRITNIMNKKQLFVKVIGKLPDTGDNNDLVIRISKAGAVKLNVLDSRFQVILNYFLEGSE